MKKIFFGFLPLAPHINPAYKVLWQGKALCAGLGLGQKLPFTLFCLLWLNSTLFAQWTQQTSGTTYNLFSVFFTAPDTGYIVGDNGIILKTTNGGANWVQQISGSNSSLQSVFFTDRDTGYVLGSGFLKTTDGGANWIQQSPSLSVLNSIYFTSTDTGYAVGSGGAFQPAAIFKTANGGVSWTTQTSGTATGVALLSVFFTAPDTGYTVGSGGVILKTTNGGTNWTQQTSGTNYGLSSIYFISSDTGYAVGDEGTILITTDGGVNWATQTSGISGPTNPLRSVFFTDADTGYAVGGLSINSSIILKTTNGGANWTQKISGISNSLYSVFFTDADTGYAVGFWGTILKTTNGGGADTVLQGIEKKSKEEFIKIHPNPTSGKIEVRSQKSEVRSIEIYNVIGEKIYLTSNIKHQTSNEINLSFCPDGIYFIKVKTTQGMFMKKIAIHR